jgi:glutamyl-tRNA reductase
MSLIALGINHRTAPVALREQVAITEERIAAALHELAALPSVSEVAILSTCNRTELYCGLEDDHVEALSEWLAHFHALDPAQIRPHLYSFPDADARDAGTLDAALKRLFQHTFAVAKQIRTDTSIGKNPVSVAFAAVSLARQIFSGFEQHTALLIGAGETIELTARHLHEQHLGRMIIANRTPERAHQLASRFNGYGIGLEEMPAHLAEADIIICATGAVQPILTREMVKPVLRQRKHRPVFMVDLAIPRNIDPDVATLDDIYLYTVDDLQTVIQENLKSRQDAASQAEDIIDTQVERFMAWLRAQDAVSDIRRYREQAERHRDRILAKARHMLANGRDPQEVLQYLANTLTNTLIHAPSVQLRQAAESGDPALLQAALLLLKPTKD